MLRLVNYYIYVIFYMIHTSYSFMEAKIVGGLQSSISEFPHSAYLSIMSEKVTIANLSWICGSSIINQKLLLTAAHCLNDCTPYCWISVSTGHSNMENGWKSSIGGFIIHDKYNPETTENDIALLRIKTPLALGLTVSRIILLEDPPYEEKAQVAGWGVIDEDKEILATKLKSLVQYIHNREECTQLLNSILPEGTICASSNISKDYASCGDSGSALVIRGYIQIGLVSFKKPNLYRHIVVYTDTAYFYNWIKFASKSLLCDEKK